MCDVLDAIERRGYEQGYAEGYAEGKAFAEAVNAKILHKNGYSIERIMEITGKTKNTIQDMLQNYCKYCMPFSEAERIALEQKIEEEVKAYKREICNIIKTLKENGHSIKQIAQIVDETEIFVKSVLKCDGKE